MRLLTTHIIIAILWFLFVSEIVLPALDGGYIALVILFGGYLVQLYFSYPIFLNIFKKVPKIPYYLGKALGAISRDFKKGMDENK